MRVMAVCVVFATSAVAIGGSYEGTVVFAGQDKVVIQTKNGDTKTFTLSQTVKENKAPSIGYPLLHRQLVFGMRIDVDSIRKDGVDEAQGYRFLAPPP
ncbi:MAG: hypothetical protein C0501_29495 [Isosphaera sp.]|nr:hypothetical protein [Isosphaera sp.]